MKLYNFWRSGTSHRTRIALNLKGLDTEYLAVHLGKEKHLSDEFKAVNPQQLVVSLAHEADPPRGSVQVRPSDLQLQATAIGKPKHLVSSTVASKCTY